MDLRGVYLSDIRVRRQANYLVERGHTVHVVSQQYHDRPATEQVDGVNIHRVPSPPLGLTQINELVRHITLFHPQRYRVLTDIVKDIEPDVLHSHDLNTARYGSFVARKNDLAHILDLHELYPESISAWRSDISWSQRFRPNVLFTPRRRWDTFEGTYLSRADALVTISDSAKEHFLTKYPNLPSNKIYVVRNVPDLQRLESISTDKLPSEEQFTVGYVGVFSPQRGLEDSIRAIAEVSEDIPTIKLLLVGDTDIPGYREKLEKLAIELGVEENVEFTGWVDFELVPSYIANSDVGLLTLTEYGDSSHALPNKLFQYMFYQTPVIISDMPAMRSVVESSDSGLIVPPGDHTELAMAIRRIHDAPNKARQMGLNGSKAVQTEYNFTNEVEILEKSYEYALVH